MLLVVGSCSRRGAAECAPDRAWAFGAAAVARRVYALVEPFSLVLTPLLFLFAGDGRPGADVIASATEVDARRRGPRRLGSPSGSSLAVATLVSLQMLAARDVRAVGPRLRRGLGARGRARACSRGASAPPSGWRCTWPLDGRAGDDAAGDRARDLIAEAVDDHPWDVDVRLWAADVETLLRDDAAARAWIDEHLERFPATREGSGKRPQTHRAARENSLLAGA